MVRSHLVVLNFHQISTEQLPSCASQRRCSSGNCCAGRPLNHGRL